MDTLVFLMVVVIATVLSAPLGYVRVAIQTNHTRR
jgi:hypothetical protein